jgi:hypothetical protein
MDWRMKTHCLQNKLVFPWQGIQIICPLGSRIMTAADINHNSYHRLPPCPSNHSPRHSVAGRFPFSRWSPGVLTCPDFPFLNLPAAYPASIRNARRRFRSVLHRKTAAGWQALEIGFPAVRFWMASCLYNIHFQHSEIIDYIGLLRMDYFRVVPISSKCAVIVQNGPKVS